METKVKFYCEPFISKNAGYKSKNIFLTEWCCRSRQEIVMYVMAMLVGATLKYKHFMITAYNSETGELIHSTVHYNLNRRTNL